MHARPLLLLLLLATARLMAQTAPVWRLQGSGTQAGLRGIVSVDGQVAWASGTGGTVLRTLDGGAHWQACATPDGDKDGATLDFRGVQAWDSRTALVMASGPGAKSRLYKTTDGCRTWQLLFTNPDKDGFFDTLVLFREQRSLQKNEGFGLLLGDSVGGELILFETRDGGETWTRLHDPTLATKGSAFAASNMCIANTDATNDIIFSDSGHVAMLRLNYQGYYWRNDQSPLQRSWTKIQLPMEADEPGKGAFALSRRVEILRAPDGITTTGLRLFEVAVGGDYTKPNDSAGTAVFSRDGGLHWSAAEKPPHGYRSAVAWDQAEKLWIAAGPNGSDWSADDGRTWHPLDDGNWNALSLPFVVGPNGRIARIDPQALGARRQESPGNEQ